MLLSFPSTHICTHPYAHAHALAHALANVLALALATHEHSRPLHTKRHTYTRTKTCTRKDKYTQRRARTQTHTHAYTQTCTHTHTSRQTHTHKHTEPLQNTHFVLMLATLHSHLFSEQVLYRALDSGRQPLPPRIGMKCSTEVGGGGHACGVPGCHQTFVDVIYIDHSAVTYLSVHRCNPFAIHG